MLGMLLASSYRMKATTIPKFLYYFYTTLAIFLYFEQNRFEKVKILSGSEKQTKLSTNKLNFDQERSTQRPQGNIVLIHFQFHPNLICKQFYTVLTLRHSDTNCRHYNNNVYQLHRQTQSVSRWDIVPRQQFCLYNFGRNYEQRQNLWGSHKI